MGVITRALCSVYSYVLGNPTQWWLMTSSIEFSHVHSLKISLSWTWRHQGNTTGTDFSTETHCFLASILQNRNKHSCRMWCSGLQKQSFAQDRKKHDEILIWQVLDESSSERQTVNCRTDTNTASSRSNFTHTVSTVIGASADVLQMSWTKASLFREVYMIIPL